MIEGSSELFTCLTSPQTYLWKVSKTLAAVWERKKLTISFFLRQSVLAVLGKMESYFLKWRLKCKVCLKEIECFNFVNWSQKILKWWLFASLVLLRFIWHLISYTYMKYTINCSNISMYPWNYHYTQNNEHIHHKIFLMSLCYLFSTSPSFLVFRQTLFYFLSF